MRTSLSRTPCNAETLLNHGAHAADEQARGPVVELRCWVDAILAVGAAGGCATGCRVHASLVLVATGPVDVP
jgi:hypothetical protein